MPRDWSRGASEADPRPTLERIRERGVVRVGYANEAPFAYMDTANGRLTGEARTREFLSSVLGNPPTSG